MTNKTNAVDLKSITLFSKNTEFYWHRLSALAYRLTTNYPLTIYSQTNLSPTRHYCLAHVPTTYFPICHPGHFIIFLAEMFKNGKMIQLSLPISSCLEHFIRGRQRATATRNNQQHRDTSFKLFL